MRRRALGLRLTALAGLTAIALLGTAAEPDVAPAPGAAPAILDVTFAPQRLRAGQPFDVTIHTTPDITALEADVMKYKVPVPRASDGVFYAQGRVPWWAHFYHGVVHVTFVGTDPNGDQAQMEAEVRI